jgi:DnaJ-class molecular chaperone
LHIAYRGQKLSKKYHPDVNPSEAAHEKFIEVAKGELFAAVSDVS